MTATAHGWTADTDTERWTAGPHQLVRYADLVRRVQALEADSHPPMPYVTCSECWALIAEESWDKHTRWHQRTTRPELGGTR